MYLPNSFPFSNLRSRIRISGLSSAFLLFGSVLGILAAYLLASGQWQMAFGLIFILPVSILIFKYPFYSVIVWLLLMPFLVNTTTVSGRIVYWMVHRALPPFTVGVLILSHLLRIRKLPKLGTAEMAMIGYIAISLSSIALIAVTPQATAIRFYDRIFSPMCLYFIIRLSAPREKEIKWLVPAILFIGVSQALIGILSWRVPELLPRQWLDYVGSRTTGSLENYDVYSTTMVFVGLFLLHAGLNRKPGLGRIILLSVFILSVFCVLISFSRGNWLSGIFVLFGLIFLYPKFIIRWLIVTIPVMVLLLGLLLPGSFSYAYERLNDRQTALSRLPVAVASFRMFEAKPWFGWGYGNFNFYDYQFFGRVADLINGNQNEASHNQYLSIAAEQGILGLFLFLTPVLWWLSETVRTKRKIPAEGFWSWKFLILLWLFLLNYFIVNNFVQTIIVFGLGLWWLTLGLIANLISIESKQELTDPISEPEQISWNGTPTEVGDAHRSG